ncbi:MAG: hypothetical protein HOQ28_03560 [Thermoleophilia bacterium]|nr:hypothetical protein [Thermoleophilia bacterium]
MIALPLYEILLRFPDRDEMRITDRDGYELGATFRIGRRTFIVVGREDPTGAGADARIVAKPSPGSTGGV